jgi:hypothetical protein
MRLYAPFFALLVGCSSSSGGTTPSDVGSDASADAIADTVAEAAPDAAACTLVAAYSSSNAVCNGCAQSKCCAEVNGCLGDPRCNDDYVNCILACALLPDDAGADADAAGAAADCVAKCGTDYPVGKTEYDTAIGCVDAKCGSECQ